MSSSSSAVAAAKIRLVSFNDVYELANLPRVQTFLSQISSSSSTHPQAIILAGDFLSPSTLSALDGGKGMVATLRAIGLTHASLGNHEADLRLSKLRKRLTELSRSVTILNANIGPPPPQSKTSHHADWFKPGGLHQCLRHHQQQEKDESNISDRAHDEPSLISNDMLEMPSLSVISSPCGRVNIGLAGLLSDEKGMFRDGTFRGAPIANVCETVSRLHEQYCGNGDGNDVSAAAPEVDCIIPITHQSIDRDKELAEYMLSEKLFTAKGLILGGHEHVPIDETVSVGGAGRGGDNDASADVNDNFVRILKSGCDAKAVSLIDLTFDWDEHDDKAQLVDIDSSLVEMSQYDASVPVQTIVDAHSTLLHSLDHEEIIQAGNLLPPGVDVLSSVGTRYRQTCVGALICTACKEELECNVCVINGATIKGNTAYDATSLTYAELKRELPFPTKMVVVPMKRYQLHEAIYYSRTHNPTDEEAGVGVETDDDEDADLPPKFVERRGYLQVDLEFERLGFHTGGQDDDLYVALPRNLMKGFCKIEPLMALGDKLEAEGLLPPPDDFVPAIELVTRHFSKERWYDLVRDHYSFERFDIGGKGYLTKEDIALMLEKATGKAPADFVLDDMIDAIDEDGNGVIDPGEWSHLLATMERERNDLIRFL